MHRTIPLILSGLLFLTTAPGFADDGNGRHSGRVLEVRQGTLVMEEMGPWLGPNTGLVTRSFQLAPDTRVRVIRPTAQWATDTSPGYDVQAMDLSQLKPGDYVTVVARGDGGAGATIEVMRTDAIDGAAASPRTEPRQ